MDLPSRHVLHLSRKIGARYAGSDGEIAAASYILRTMSDAEIDVTMERFSTWKSDLQGLIVIYLVSLIAFLIFPVSYTASFIMSLGAFLAFQMETYTWGVASRLFPRSGSSNVVGRVKASDEARRTVVLTANYDSAKASPLGRIPRAFRVLYIVSFVCIIVIGIVGIIGTAAALAKVERNTLLTIWLSISVFPAYLFVISVIILWGEIFGRHSPGANDNASGVAVMLSVLVSLAGNPLERTEVWGVATGRGFSGGRGMVALLKSRRRQLADALIINIDHPCGEPTRIITREGPMLGFHCSRRLQKIVLGAAAKSKGLDVEKGKCRIKKSDAMVARARGIKAVSIGCVKGGTYKGWRNRSDVFDEIDRKALDRTVKLVQLVLDEIDQGA